MTARGAWRRALWEAIGEALSAHIVMLRDSAIIDDASAAALLGAVANVRQGAPPEVDGSLALVAAFDERFDSLSAAGIAGGARIGRTSHDLAATAQWLVLRERALTLSAALDQTRAALIDLAEQHVFTLMNAWAGNTPVQPTNLAHFLTGTIAPLGRAARRLRVTVDTFDQSPMGAASLAGPGLPIDREETADLLGSAGPVESTYDALSAIDHYVALGDDARLAVAPLRRLASELLVWARTDAQAFRLAEDVLAPADLTLPTFRPPRALERLASDARQVESGADIVARLALDLPYGPLGELGDEVVTRTVETLAGAARVAEAFLALVGASLEINRAWLARNAGRDLVTTGDLALFLMAEEGLDPASAQQIAAMTASRARQEGLEASAIGPAMIDAAALLVIGRELGVEVERLGAYLAPRRFVEKRTILGGPAAPAVREFLERERERLHADRRWLEARRHRLAQARETLEQRTREILAAAE
jgi:argininosuccinate lyase